MKNRVVCAFLASLMITAMVGSNTLSVCAADVTKDETVYITTDEYGKEKSIVVSDQLKNIDSITQIEDISSLLDIENVKGDEVFKQNGSNLVWENDGSSEICYQGTAEEQTPVGLNIAYELNGTSIKAEALKGKSGHLKVTVAYTNRTAGKEYTPFLMATALILKGDGYTNITAENGRPVSDGEKNTVIGFGVPGLKEYLNLSEKDLDLVDLDLPDNFSMEADVENYEGITFMTMAISNLFSDIKSDDIKDTDDLKNSMNDLQSAANQLIDGTAQLKDGVDTLLSSSGTLTDGVKQLDDGGKELANGTKALVDGSFELKTGAAALAAGTEQLSGGSEALAAGAKQVSDGTTAARTGADQLNAGLGELKQGVASMKDQTAAGITSLNDGAGLLVGGMAQAQAGANQLEAGIASVKSGAGSLKAGVGQAQEGVSGISKLAQGIAAAVPSQVTVNNIPVSGTADNSAYRSAVYNYLISEGVDPGIASAASGLIGDASVNTTASATVDISAQTGAAAAYANQIVDTASQVNSGLGTVAAGADQLEGALGSLETGASDLADSLSESGTLGGGAVTIRNGIGTMGQTLGSGTEALAAAVEQLHGGSRELSTGLIDLEKGTAQVSSGAIDLKNGILAADIGAKQLADGTTALWTGADTLSTGSDVLSAGLSTLNNGSGKLIEGITALDNGAGDLNNGMIQFNEEGIQKLVSLFGGDMDELLDKFKDMIDNAEQYTSYSGKTESMDGEVKFIFVTEE